MEVTPAKDLDERSRMRQLALARPSERVRLADRASKAGQAIDGDDKLQAEKWFALAAEIRAMGISQKPSTEVITEVREKHARLKESRQPPPAPASEVVISEPETEPVVEETPTSKVSPLTERKRKFAKRPKSGSKYDKQLKEILFDYERMPVRTLERKWKMGRSFLYKLLEHWKAKGITIPIAYTDRQTKPIVEKTPHMKLGRPEVGKRLKCVDCGKDIYVKKHRLDKNPEGKEYRCRKCASKHYLPPKRIKKIPAVKEERGTTLATEVKKLQTDKAITPEARRVLDGCLDHSLLLFERAFAKAKSEYLSKEQIEDAYWETVVEFVETSELQNQMSSWIRELSGTADNAFIRGAIYALQKVKMYFVMLAMLEEAEEK